MKITSLRITDNGLQELLDEMSEELNVICGPREVRHKVYASISQMLFGGASASNKTCSGDVGISRGDEDQYLQWDASCDRLNSPIVSRELDEGSQSIGEWQSAFVVDFANPCPVNKLLQTVAPSVVAARTNLSLERDAAITQLTNGRKRLCDELDLLNEELERIDIELQTIDGSIAAGTNQAQIAPTMPSNGLSVDTADSRTPLDDHVANLQSSLQILKQRSRHIDEQLNDLERTDEPSDSNPPVCLKLMQQLQVQLNSQMDQLTASDSMASSLDQWTQVAHVTELLHQEAGSIHRALRSRQSQILRKQLTQEKQQLDQSCAAIVEQIESWKLAERPADRDQKVETTDVNCQCDWHRQDVADGVVEKPAIAFQEESREVLQELHIQRGQILRKREVASQQLAALESELKDVETELSQLHSSNEQPAPIKGDLTTLQYVLNRASGYLDRLTDGELCSIRHENETVVLTDSSGDFVTADMLTSGQRDQLTLSLVLAIVDRYADHGIHLPLLLNDPLLRLEQHEYSVAADVLHEFARQDRQVLVFTDNGLPASDMTLVMTYILGWDGIRLDSEDDDCEFELASPDEFLQLDCATLTRSDDESSEDFTLRRADAIERFELDDHSAHSRLRQLGVTTIGDLLDINLVQVSEQLASLHLNVDHIRSWQSRAALQCYVEGLTALDAILIVASGVEDSEQLAQTDEDKLFNIAHRILIHEFGEDHDGVRRRYTRERFQKWIDRARGTADQWRSQTRTRRPRRRTNDRRRIPELSERIEVKEGVTTKSSRGSEVAESSTTLRFYLELSDPVVDAPSVGPKMSELMEPHGVVTVRDFIDADADSLATKLDNRRAPAETIREWQKQSRLMCQVPQIRGHDVQILIACEIDDPRALSEMQPQHLLSIVEPLVETKVGERILRGANKPDLDEVTDWINWAKSSRQLRAA